MPDVYCGPAPAPQTLLFAWNFDFIALALCAALLGLHRFSGSREGRPALIAGTFFLALLFLSPLCALTVSLFSARVAHHALLIAVAAPLLALAFRKVRFPAPALPLSALVAVNALLLWFWHVPQVYEVAIVGTLPYWTMQLSLLGAAFALWRAVLAPAAHPGSAIFALLATMVQMGMLGALLTFARAPLYAAHFGTTQPFGLSPLADQQLAGLIMWVPASLPYLVAALLLLSAQLAPASRRVR
ncbi:cytochrome c oxidase assembly protein [Stappia sp. 28M-7]|uniref:cytochrome c oxidase assembly protein n=1 Tax=Stappia sp. 28M-7 TaxID=2762596 RepID=UPI00163C6138|nr:cytochrome c oxidase assembly protein [Stappia sp. 28M-7]MBC2860888.1 cytochrome c oxidase assembly protein [Stappia sp. 28M-7]